MCACDHVDGDDHGEQPGQDSESSDGGGRVPDHAYALVGPMMGLFGSSLGTVRLRAVSSMRVE